MPRRVMFASYHCHHDPASGAAVCTRDLFRHLALRGWSCGSFTGPKLDDVQARPVGERLLKVPGWTSASGRAEGTTFTLYSHTGGQYRSSVFAPDPPHSNRPPTPSEAAVFLGVFQRAIQAFRPDVVLTYGGDAASQGVIPVARNLGVPVVFWLHNFAYTTAEAFRGCAAVVVPSRFSQDHYRRILHLDTLVLPPIIDPVQVVAQDRTPKYLVFVNPEPVKGAFWFARIAEVLGNTRPDIPILVVEGRGTVNWLGQCGLDLTRITSVHRMKNTPDPRQFYRLAKLVLMPSVWNESFGRVAVEALMNRIPVLASNRGALPEVTGDSGLSLPDWLTPSSRQSPSAEEVQSWIDRIVELWDDPIRYADSSEAARQVGERWRPEIVLPQWEVFLSALSGHSK